MNGKYVNTFAFGLAVIVALSFAPYAAANETTRKCWETKDVGSGTSGEDGRCDTSADWFNKHFVGQLRPVLGSGPEAGKSTSPRPAALNIEAADFRYESRGGGISPMLYAANRQLAANSQQPAGGAPTQGGTASTGASPGHEELSKAAVDPTASLMSFAFWNITTVNYYDRPGSANQIQFQPAIPFKAFGATNILRLTMPYNTGGVPGRGLGNVVLFNLTIIPVKGGRFAIGPVMNFVSNPRLTTDRFQIGPALGYVASKGKWTFGGLMQNLFSGDTQVSVLQPILTYQLGGGWAIGYGSPEFTIDWKGGRFVDIPFGVDIGKVFAIGGQKMRATFNPEYNAASVSGMPHWTIKARIVLLAPEG